MRICGVKFSDKCTKLSLKSHSEVIDRKSKEKLPARPVGYSMYIE